MNGVCKIIREEYFPFLVENGFDSLGILLWIDYGKYWKVQLKSEYETTNSNSNNYPDKN